MTKRVVITGANRGIGLELARAYAGRGDEVHAAARKPDEAAELRAIAGVKVHGLDVTDAASVGAFARELGDAPIHLLINNAGVGGKWRALTEIDFDEMRANWEVNALGPLRVTAALLPALRAAKGALVVNVTSRMGSIGDTDQGRAYAYRMSKAAQNMATKNFSIELAGDRITTIALHPGWVQTDMGGRGAPTPLAKAVAQITKLLDETTPARNGKFLHAEGHELPW
jgi:NAD(P)-dependent dehydrogenase (short-subunit alcohol dehydrogenase family)